MYLTPLYARSVAGKDLHFCYEMLHYIDSVTICNQKSSNFLPVLHHSTTFSLILQPYAGKHHSIYPIGALSDLEHGPPSLVSISSWLVLYFVIVVRLLLLFRPPNVLVEPLHFFYVPMAYIQSLLELWLTLKVYFAIENFLLGTTYTIHPVSIHSRLWQLTYLIKGFI